MFLKMKANVHRALNMCQALPKCFLYVMSFSSPKNPLCFIISTTKLKLARFSELPWLHSKKQSLVETRQSLSGAYRTKLQVVTTRYSLGTTPSDGDTEKK